MLGLLLHLEGGKESRFLLLDALEELESREYFVFINLPLHRNDKRLPRLYNAHDFSVRHHECLHRVKKIDAQIELLAMQRSNGDISLTFPLAN